jgi:catechol 2,3-dioxygenase-like lactoylglutathione lyase family enzyme
MDRRTFLAALPALALTPRALAQSPVAGRFRVNGLSQITLTVSDVARSLDFYQGLFGMPVQARQGSAVLLRIGNGPRFLALRQAATGENPSISALGFGVNGFSIDGAVQTLTAHGFTAAPSDAPKPGPKQMLVRTRRQDEGGAADGSTRDLFAADPSGVVFQLHDVSYCGGSGALGSVCTAVQPSAKKGNIALKDTSHFTINATDPTTVQMYLDMFGFAPLAYQAQTPGWQVGNGVHFLMFIGGGGPTRGNAGAPAGPARGGAPGGGAPGGGVPGGGAGPAPAAAAAAVRREPAVSITRASRWTTSMRRPSRSCSSAMDSSSRMARGAPRSSRTSHCACPIAAAPRAERRSCISPILTGSRFRSRT